MPEQEPAQRTQPSQPTVRSASRAQRWRAGALIGVLIGLLGFAIAVQVHANSSRDSLQSLSEPDLIGILDDQNARADRLRQQIDQLQQTLRTLTANGNNSQAARAQAEQEQQTLGILLGTVPATGPGVEIAITDSRHVLHAEDMLDVLAELRGAGAEAISFGGVRVSTNSAFTDRGSAIALDGTTLTAPYDVLAIGEPKTLDTALNIPGGIAAAIRTAGGSMTVTERTAVKITAVRPLPAMTQAHPAR